MSNTTQQTLIRLEQAAAAQGITVMALLNSLGPALTAPPPTIPPQPVQQTLEFPPSPLDVSTPIRKSSVKIFGANTPTSAPDTFPATVLPTTAPPLPVHPAPPRDRLNFQLVNLPVYEEDITDFHETGFPLTSTSPTSIGDPSIDPQDTTPHSQPNPYPNSNKDVPHRHNTRSRSPNRADKDNRRSRPDSRSDRHRQFPDHRSHQDSDRRSSKKSDTGCRAFEHFGQCKKVKCDYSHASHFRGAKLRADKPPYDPKYSASWTGARTDSSAPDNSTSTGPTNA